MLPPNSRREGRAAFLNGLALRARANIRSDKDLRRYVFRTSLVCVAVALVVDVLSQLVFFQSWEVAFRSWAITIVVAVGIAVPVLSIIARAYLELYRAKAAVDELSRTDPLTGLLNRRALFEEEAGAPAIIALVIIDIDRFKRINDRHGHLIGDEVIRMVAHILERTLGDLGKVGRLGGEEFAVLASAGKEVQLVERLERFRAQVAETAMVCSGERVYVTISAGFATRAAGQSFDELYAAADRALYAAKAAGRNRVLAAEDAPDPLPPSAHHGWDVRASRSRGGRGG